MPDTVSSGRFAAFFARKYCLVSAAGSRGELLMFSVGRLVSMPKGEKQGMHTDDLSEEELMKQLEHHMYGYNYAVTFGFNLLEGSKNIIGAKNTLKTIYTNANTEKVKETSKDEFWEQIEYGLNYRGDEWSGLSLNEEAEQTLHALQRKYKEFISKYLKQNTIIYQMLDDKGLPGYPVWWNYHFILLNEDGKSMFIYGTSSD